MSKAIKCDRCGECFDPCIVSGKFGRIGAYTMQDARTFSRNEYTFTVERIDLCPECIESFNEWFDILGTRKNDTGVNEKDGVQT